MPDTLNEILEALPLGAEVELLTEKNEYGQRVTHVRTGNRTLSTLDHDAGLRTGRPLTIRRAS